MSRKSTVTGWRLTSRMSSPRRGEVWIADLDPTQGAEMRKTRPVVIINSDAVGSLPIRLAAPCTTTRLAPAVWRVPVAATKRTGLDRDTTVDLMQTRALSTTRLARRIGHVSESEMSEIAAAMAVVVEYV